MLAVISPEGSPRYLDFGSLVLKGHLAKRECHTIHSSPPPWPILSLLFFGDTQKLVASACLKTVPEPKELLTLVFHSLSSCLVLEGDFS